LGICLLIDINGSQKHQKLLDMLLGNNTFNTNKPAGI